ncbi:MAG: hypothetical protein AAGD00_09385 [Planctomycetota bacterium]
MRRRVSQPACLAALVCLVLGCGAGPVACGNASDAHGASSADPRASDRVVGRWRVRTAGSTGMLRLELEPCGAFVYTNTEGLHNKGMTKRGEWRREGNRIKLFPSVNGQPLPFPFLTLIEARPGRVLAPKDDQLAGREFVRG